MPIYRYRCKCGNEIEKFRLMKNGSKRLVCECGRKMKRLFISGLPAVIPDRFGGVIDKRLGSEPLKSKKDYNSRLKQKGLAEITDREARSEDF